MCLAYFWWELVEMLKRFLLVGLYVLDMGPFLRGSVMQLALANFTLIIFLVAQLQAQPYVMRRWCLGMHLFSSARRSSN